MTMSPRRRVSPIKPVSYHCTVDPRYPLGLEQTGGIGTVQTHEKIHSEGEALSLNGVARLIAFEIV